MRISRHLQTALVAGAITAAAAGCGGTARTGATPGRSTATGTPAAFTSPDANPVAVPPVSERALRSGSDAQRITRAIVAFYRAAWEGQGSTACAQFSPQGRTGFLRAAHVAFPQGVGARSTCAHAMALYNAALGDSASNAEAADPSFSTAPLDHVGVAGIEVRGRRATAIAPTNVVQLINPERFELVRSGGRWYIDSSHSLNRSNLQAILRAARSNGLLSRKRG